MCRVPWQEAYTKSNEYRKTYLVVLGRKFSTAKLHPVNITFPFPFEPDSQTMPSQLASVCTALPHIQILQPSDSSFAAKRETYFAAPTNNPAAIACPTSAEQVSDLIRYTKDFNVPFSVRTGGHDVYGRSVIRDALCIDMRAFNTITIATDRQTATIGGGVLAGPLQRALCKEGLTTPTGNVSDVGYVGWACGGGYGPLSGQFGLGVDQIRGTEIVDAHGEVRMATATELRGIRGAGGNFGIITSMEIKIYDVEKVSQCNRA